MSVNEERKRRFAERAGEMKYGSIIKHFRKRKGGLKRQRKITLPVARERERERERERKKEMKYGSILRQLRTRKGVCRERER